MVLIVLIYLAVSLTAIQIMGADAFGQSVDGDAAPLLMVAQALSVPLIGTIVMLAAITAMLGALLNLLLGLSRVMLGMSRRKGLPSRLAQIDTKTQSPATAVWVTGAIIGFWY
jgi:APA family basic amino acid/polyamine antiporter